MRVLVVVCVVALFAVPAADAQEHLQEEAQDAEVLAELAKLETLGKHANHPVRSSSKAGGKRVAVIDLEQQTDTDTEAEPEAGPPNNATQGHDAAGVAPLTVPQKDAWLLPPTAQDRLVVPRATQHVQASEKWSRKEEGKFLSSRLPRNTRPLSKPNYQTDPQQQFMVDRIPPNPALTDQQLLRGWDYRMAWERALDVSVSIPFVSKDVTLSDDQLGSAEADFQADNNWRVLANAMVEEQRVYAWCQDNADFVDSRGRTCDELKPQKRKRALETPGGPVCDPMELAEELGFAEARFVLGNCTRTCGHCNVNACEDDPNAGCHKFVGLECRTADSIPNSERSEALLRCPRTCQVCPGECWDNLGFVDEQGYGCASWKGKGACTLATSAGYSVFGMQQLVQSCPMTCHSTCTKEAFLASRGRSVQSDRLFVVDAILVLPNTFKPSWEAEYATPFSTAVGETLGVDPAAVILWSVKPGSVKIHFGVKVGHDKHEASLLVIRLRDVVRSGALRKSLEKHSGLFVPGLKLLLESFVELAEVNNENEGGLLDLPPDVAVNTVGKGPRTSASNVRFFPTVKTNENEFSSLGGVVTWNPASSSDVTHYRVYCSQDGVARDKMLSRPLEIPRNVHAFTIPDSVYSDGFHFIIVVTYNEQTDEENPDNPSCPLKSLVRGDALGGAEGEGEGGEGERAREASEPPGLSSLEVVNGLAMLLPPFDPCVRDYSLVFDPSESLVALRAVAASGSRVETGGQVLQASSTPVFAVGTTTPAERRHIQFVVTAADGTATTTFTLDKVPGKVDNAAHLTRVPEGIPQLPLTRGSSDQVKEIIEDAFNSEYVEKGVVDWGEEGGTALRGQALRLGEGSVVELDGVGVQAEFTVAAWVYITEVQGRHAIRCDMAQLTAGNNRLDIVNSRLQWTMTGNSPEAHTFKFNFYPNRWYHLAVAYSSLRDTVSLFLNGKMLEQKFYSEQTVPWQASGHMTVGSFKGKSDFFKGLIKNLQIWDAAMSRYGVELLYRQDIGSKPMVHLIANYRMDGAVEDARGSFRVHRQVNVQFEEVSIQEDNESSNIALYTPAALSSVQYFVHKTHWHHGPQLFEPTNPLTHEPNSIPGRAGQSITVTLRFVPDFPDVEHRYAVEFTDTHGNVGPIETVGGFVAEAVTVKRNGTATRYLEARVQIDNFDDSKAGKYVIILFVPVGVRFPPFQIHTANVQPRCTTSELNNAENTPCALPFVYKGMPQDDCIALPDREDGWCSLTKNWVGAWGYCKPRGDKCGVDKTDATLSALGLSLGELEPHFAPDITRYRAVVDEDVAKVEVMFKAHSPGAKVVVGTATDAGELGNVVASPELSGPVLSDASTDVIVLVTSADGSAHQEYHVTVEKANKFEGGKLASDTALAVFEVVGGSKPHEAGDVWISEVPQSVPHVAIRARPTSPRAEVTVRDELLRHGSLSEPILVKCGRNSLSIKVRAQDESATSVLRLVVVRNCGQDPTIAAVGSAFAAYNRKSSPGAVDRSDFVQGYLELVGHEKDDQDLATLVYVVLRSTQGTDSPISLLDYERGVRKGLVPVARADSVFKASINQWVSTRYKNEFQKFQSVGSISQYVLAEYGAHAGRAAERISRMIEFTLLAHFPGFETSLPFSAFARATVLGMLPGKDDELVVELWVARATAYVDAFGEADADDSALVRHLSKLGFDHESCDFMMRATLELSPRARQTRKITFFEYNEAVYQTLFPNSAPSAPREWTDTIPHIVREFSAFATGPDYTSVTALVQHLTAQGVGVAEAEAVAAAADANDDDVVSVHEYAVVVFAGLVEAKGCEDDAAFTDTAGLKCDAWVQFACKNAEAWAYTEAAKMRLLRSCPLSCRSCYFSPTEGALPTVTMTLATDYTPAWAADNATPFKAAIATTLGLEDPALVLVGRVEQGNGGVVVTFRVRSVSVVLIRKALDDAVNDGALTKALVAGGLEVASVSGVTVQEASDAVQLRKGESGVSGTQQQFTANALEVFAKLSPSGKADVPEALFLERLRALVNFPDPADAGMLFRLVDYDHSHTASFAEFRNAVVAGVVLIADQISVTSKPLAHVRLLERQWEPNTPLVKLVTSHFTTRGFTHRQALLITESILPDSALRDWPTSRDFAQLARAAKADFLKQAVGRVVGVPDAAKLDAMDDDQLANVAEKGAREHLAESLSRAVIAGLFPDPSDVRGVKHLRTCLRLFETMDKDGDGELSVEEMGPTLASTLHMGDEQADDVAAIIMASSLQVRESASLGVADVVHLVGLGLLPPSQLTDSRSRALSQLLEHTQKVWRSYEAPAAGLDAAALKRGLSKVDVTPTTMALRVDLVMGGQQHVTMPGFQYAILWGVVPNVVVPGFKDVASFSIQAGPGDVDAASPSRVDAVVSSQHSQRFRESLAKYVDFGDNHASFDGIDLQGFRGALSAAGMSEHESSALASAVTNDHNAVSFYHFLRADALGLLPSGESEGHVPQLDRLLERYNNGKADVSVPKHQVQAALYRAGLGAPGVVELLTSPGVVEEQVDLAGLLWAVVRGGLPADLDDDDQCGSVVDAALAFLEIGDFSGKAKLPPTTVATGLRRLGFDNEAAKTMMNAMSYSTRGQSIAFPAFLRVTRVGLIPPHSPPATNFLSSCVVTAVEMTGGAQSIPLSAIEKSLTDLQWPPDMAKKLVASVFGSVGSISPKAYCRALALRLLPHKQFRQPAVELHSARVLSVIQNSMSTTGQQFVAMHGVDLSHWGEESTTVLQRAIQSDKDGFAHAPRVAMLVLRGMMAEDVASLRPSLDRLAHPLRVFAAMDTNGDAECSEEEMYSYLTAAGMGEKVASRVTQAVMLSLYTTTDTTNLRQLTPTSVTFLEVLIALQSGLLPRFKSQTRESNTLLANALGLYLQLHRQQTSSDIVGLVDETVHDHVIRKGMRATDAPLAVDLLFSTVGKDHKKHTLTEVEMILVTALCGVPGTNQLSPRKQMEYLVQREMEFAQYGGKDGILRLSTFTQKLKDKDFRDEEVEVVSGAVVTSKTQDVQLSAFLLAAQSLVLPPGLLSADSQAVVTPKRREAAMEALLRRLPGFSRRQNLQATARNTLALEMNKHVHPLDLMLPPAITYDVSAGLFYSVVMVETALEHNSSVVPSEMVKWMVVNAYGKDVDGGETVAAYQGPTVTETSGPRALCLTLFEQRSGELAPTELPYVSCLTPERSVRSHFDLLRFANTHELRAVDGVCVVTAWDDAAPDEPTIDHFTELHGEVQLFGRYDRDASGTIEKAEFVQTLVLHGEESSHATTLFSILQRNNKITLAMFVAAVRTLLLPEFKSAAVNPKYLTKLAQLFEKHSEKAEMMGMLQRDYALDQVNSQYLYHLMDEDGNGVVKFDEFVRAHLEAILPKAGDSLDVAMLAFTIDIYRGRFDLDGSGITSISDVRQRLMSDVQLSTERAEAIATALGMLELAWDASASGNSKQIRLRSFRRGVALGLIPFAVYMSDPQSKDYREACATARKHSDEIHTAFASYPQTNGNIPNEQLKAGLMLQGWNEVQARVTVVAADLDRNGVVDESEFTALVLLGVLTAAPAASREVASIASSSVAHPKMDAPQLLKMVDDLEARIPESPASAILARTVANTYFRFANDKGGLDMGLFVAELARHEAFKRDKVQLETMADHSRGFDDVRALDGHVTSYLQFSNAIRRGLLTLQCGGQACDPNTLTAAQQETPLPLHGVGVADAVVVDEVASVLDSPDSALSLSQYVYKHLNAPEGNRGVELILRTLNNPPGLQHSSLAQTRALHLLKTAALLGFLPRRSHASKIHLLLRAAKAFASDYTGSTGVTVTSDKLRTVLHDSFGVDAAFAEEISNALVALSGLDGEVVGLYEFVRGVQAGVVPLEAAAVPKCRDQLSAAREMFQQLDVQRRGALSQLEVANALTAQQYTREAAQGVAKLIDSDNNGEVTFAEFLAALIDGLVDLRPSPNAPSTPFAQHDAAAANPRPAPNTGAPHPVAQPDSVEDVLLVQRWESLGVKVVVGGARFSQEWAALHGSGYARALAAAIGASPEVVAVVDVHPGGDGVVVEAVVKGVKQEGGGVKKDAVDMELRLQTAIRTGQFVGALTHEGIEAKSASSVEITMHVDHSWAYADSAVALAINRPHDHFEQLQAITKVFVEATQGSARMTARDLARYVRGFGGDGDNSNQDQLVADAVLHALHANHVTLKDFVECVNVHVLPVKTSDAKLPQATQTLDFVLPLIHSFQKLSTPEEGSQYLVRSLGLPPHMASVVMEDLASECKTTKAEDTLLCGVIRGVLPRLSDAAQVTMVKVALDDYLALRPKLTGVVAAAKAVRSALSLETAEANLVVLGLQGASLDTARTTPFTLSAFMCGVRSGLLPITVKRPDVRVSAFVVDTYRQFDRFNGRALSVGAKRDRLPVATVVQVLRERFSFSGEEAQAIVESAADGERSDRLDEFVFAHLMIKGLLPYTPAEVQDAKTLELAPLEDIHTVFTQLKGTSKLGVRSKELINYLMLYRMRSHEASDLFQVLVADQRDTKKFLQFPTFVRAAQRFLIPIKHHAFSFASVRSVHDQAQRAESVAVVVANYLDVSTRLADVVVADVKAHSPTLTLRGWIWARLNGLLPDPRNVAEQQQLREALTAWWELYNPRHDGYITPGLLEEALSQRAAMPPSDAQFVKALGTALIGSSTVLRFHHFVTLYQLRVVPATRDGAKDASEAIGTLKASFEKATGARPGSTVALQSYLTRSAHTLNASPSTIQALAPEMPANIGIKEFALAVADHVIPLAADDVPDEDRGQVVVADGTGAHDADGADDGVQGSPQAVDEKDLGPLEGPQLVVLLTLASSPLTPALQSSLSHALPNAPLPYPARVVWARGDGSGGVLVCVALATGDKVLGDDEKAGVVEDVKVAVVAAADGSSVDVVETSEADPLDTPPTLLTALHFTYAVGSSDSPIAEPLQNARTYPVWVDKAKDGTTLRLEMPSGVGEATVDGVRVDTAIGVSPLILVPARGTRKVDVVVTSANRLSTLAFAVVVSHPPPSFLSSLHVRGADEAVQFNPAGEADIVAWVPAGTTEVYLKPEMEGDGAMAVNQEAVTSGVEYGPLRMPLDTPAMQLVLTVTPANEDFAPVARRVLLKRETDKTNTAATAQPEGNNTTPGADGGNEGDGGPEGGDGAGQGEKVDEGPASMLVGLVASDTVLNQPAFDPAMAKSLPYTVALLHSTATTTLTLSLSPREALAVTVDDKPVPLPSSSNLPLLLASVSVELGDHVVEVTSMGEKESYVVRVLQEGGGGSAEGEGEDRKLGHVLLQVLVQHEEPFTEPFDPKLHTSRNYYVYLLPGMTTTRLTPVAAPGALLTIDEEPTANSVPSKLIQVPEFPDTVVVVVSATLDGRTKQSRVVIKRAPPQRAPFGLVVGSAIATFGDLTKAKGCAHTPLSLPVLRKYARAYGIDKEDASKLFHVLDTNADNNLSLFEFVLGVEQGLLPTGDTETSANSTNPKGYSVPADDTVLRTASEHWTNFQNLENVPLPLFLQSELLVEDKLSADILADEIHINKRKRISELDFVRAALLNVLPDPNDDHSMRRLRMALRRFRESFDTQAPLPRELFELLSRRFDITPGLASVLGKIAMQIHGVHVADKTLSVRAYMLAVRHGLVPETKPSISQRLAFQTRAGQLMQEFLTIAKGRTSVDCSRFTEAMHARGISATTASALGSAWSQDLDGHVQYGLYQVLQARGFFDAASSFESGKYLASAHDEGNDEGKGEEVVAAAEGDAKEEKKEKGEEAKESKAVAQAPTQQIIGGGVPAGYIVQTILTPVADASQAHVLAPYGAQPSPARRHADKKAPPRALMPQMGERKNEGGGVGAGICNGTKGKNGECA